MLLQYCMLFITKSCTSSPSTIIPHSQRLTNDGMGQNTTEEQEASSLGVGRRDAQLINV